MQRIYLVVCCFKFVFRAEKRDLKTRRVAICGDSPV